ELVNNNGSYALNTLYTFRQGFVGGGGLLGLIADAKGDLFGTTNRLGTHSAGSVVEFVNNNGSYAFNALVNFTGGTDRGFPRRAPLADANGDLFATTPGGGLFGDGTVFELVNTNGSYALNTLFSFSGGNGAGPGGRLLADANGDLFGTTAQGGINNHGTVFE